MNWYDVFPKVVPADQISVIRIHPRYEHCLFKDPSRIRVSYFPHDGLFPDGHIDGFTGDPDARAVPADSWYVKDGDLFVRLLFRGEQSHSIELEYEFELDVLPIYAKKKRQCAAVVYSVKEDLYRLRPFRGDFHIHSCHSDGSGDPRYVAARYREEGFDFIAVSDHRQYEPSVRTMDYWKDKKSDDFVLYPGEEVHSPDNPVHIINFAAKKSINSLYREDEAKYRREVEERVKAIPESERIPGIDYFQIAACEWVFDNIRANGGLAVYCHPYWRGNQNMLSEAVVEAVFRRRKFDAFELLGGHHKFEIASNNFQVCRWQEEQRKGPDFPVLGLSDSHGTDAFDATPAKRQEYADPAGNDLFNWFYTIVFAEENTAESLIGNIKKFHSVAVSAIPGECPGYYGSFRLVKYVTFLMHSYFPIQKNFCRTEGLLMQEYLGSGDENSLAALRQLHGSVSRFREKCFARSK